MTQEELDRFLKAVKRTRFVDYLGVGPGEAAQAALDQRLRWASRALSDPNNASEASFLLQHQDSLRAHLRDATDDGLDEEWVEYANPGEEQVRASVWVGRDSAAAGDVVDLGAFDLDDSAPRAQPDPQRPPPGPPPRPRPAALGRAAPPAPDLTPSPRPDRDPSPTSLGARASVPRGRERTPTPSISRMTPRGAPDRRSASPIAVARSARPLIPPASPYATPHPSESSRGGAASSRDRSPSPVPQYAAPGPLGATPGGRGASAVPAPGRGFDVHIEGRSDFLRSNDPYGSSSVVYESELVLGRGAGAPRPNAVSPRMTPTSVASRSEGDILANLRGSARGGGPPTPVPVGRRKRTPILGILGGAGLVTIVAALSFAAARNPLVRDALFPPPPPDLAASGDAYRPSQPAPEPEVLPSTSPLAPVEAPAVVGPAGADDPIEEPVAAPAPAVKPRPRPATTKPAATSTTPAATEAAATTEAPAPTTKPAATATTKPAATTKPTAPVAAAEPAPPEPPPEPAAPKPPMAGAWKGTVGQTACVADLSQRDTTVTGTITVAGTPFKVSGRYNAERGTILLRGTNDTSVEFRGEVREERVNGTARLGAGEMQQAWQLRK